MAVSILDVTKIARYLRKIKSNPSIIDSFKMDEFTHFFDRYYYYAENKEYFMHHFGEVHDAVESAYKILLKNISYTQKVGYIYLVKGLYENPTYKIGYSKTPIERIHKFDIVLPFPIETTHLIKTNHMRAAESYLHNKYASKRVNGEWFELSEQDVTDICAIESLNLEDIA